MNYKNKLMGLSLILLAAFSACTDDVENGGRDSGTDDHRITFAVGTESPDARTRADGSLPDAAGSYETNSVEMQGKLDGKNVYLTAEVSDGLPGDDQPLTRGTQVTGGAQVDEFSVSAAILDANVFEPETLDVMYNVKVAKDNASSTWTTGTPYYWPTGKKLTFFAWYPYNSKNLTIPKDNNVKDTKLLYEIPEQVADQEDFMMANSYEVSETSSVPIWFRHMLTAVKFKTGNNIPACTVKSIALKKVKYKGYHNWQAHGSGILPWNPDADTRDFTLDFPNGKKVSENTETELTGEGETFLMYCVEQKALTADFGFKDCERNISREAEKWNIVVDATGARLKDEVTKLQARVVISSNIDDTQISDLGRDLTYGDPASIYIDKATMTGISVKPYVKKRWDNGVNDATNNGERTVNVQVKRADSDDWCDIDTKGTMSDRFYWGKNYCIGTDTYYAGETTKNDWNDCAAKILTAYWKVHKNHPLFGLYRWTIPRLDTKADVNTNPLYAVHSASKGLNGLNVNSLYGVVGLSPNMLYQGCTKVTSIVDPDNPQSAWNAIYNNDIGTFMVGGKGDWPNNWDASWSDGAHCAQWYPIVYAADYSESSDRPTDEHPITGKSVNE